MDKDFLPISAAKLVGNERAYVLDCIDSSWISSTGDYVNRFKRAFAEFCGTEHAVTCSNGTTALHLALLALGVGPGRRGHRPHVDLRGHGQCRRLLRREASVRGQ